MKKHLQTKIFNLLIFIFCIQALKAQDVSSIQYGSETNNYLNLSADLFNGRAGISIPIHIYKSKHIEIPITLDYNPIDLTTGHKVYNSGWIGLGWNLRVGGMISRNTNGVIDENEDKGNFKNTTSTIFNSEVNEPDEDEFSFNFNGYNGIFIKHRGEWKVLNENRFVNIICNLDTRNSKNVISGFEITTDDGYKYVFGGSNATEYTKLKENYSYSNYDDEISTAWFLNKIISPEGDAVFFEYEPSVTFNPIDKKTTIKSREYSTNESGGIIYDTYGTGEYFTVSEKPSDEQIANLSYGYEICSVILSKISCTSSNSVINFNSTNNLYLDFGGVLNYYNVKKLENLIINNNEGGLTINFDYDAVLGETIHLKSIQMRDNANNFLPKYEFNYYDFNHEVCPGVLSEIKYPTGAYSSLEFEKNDYGVVNTYIYNSNNGSGFVENPNSFQIITTNNNTETHGFRIKKIYTKSDINSNRSFVKSYFYTETMPNINSSTQYLPTSGVKAREIINIKEEIVKWIDGKYYGTRIESPYDCIKPYEDTQFGTHKTALGYSSVWEVQSDIIDDEIVNIQYKNTMFNNYYKKNGLGFSYQQPGLVGKKSSETIYDMNKSVLSQIGYTYVPISSENLYRCGTKSYIFRAYNQDIYHTERAIFQTTIKNYALDKIEYIQSDKPGTNEFFTYDSSNRLTKTTKYNYRIDYSQSSIDPNSELTWENFESYTKKIKYITDFDNGTGANKNIPVEIVMLQNNKVVNATFTKYESRILPNGTVSLPTEIYKLELENPISEEEYENIRPGSDWSVSQHFKLKTTLTYDDFGNLLQIQNSGQEPIAYYYYQNLNILFQDKSYKYPSVEAKNCSFVDLQSAISNISDLEDDNSMRLLRKNLPNALITNYKYDSRFGVRSVTAPNGYTIYKNFDNFGRVTTVTDGAGNILQANKYNMGF